MARDKKTTNFLLGEESFVFPAVLFLQPLVLPLLAVVFVALLLLLCCQPRSSCSLSRQRAVENDLASLISHEIAALPWE